MARTAVVATKILELLSKSHFLTANQIRESLLKSGEKYNKTSIYRAIDGLLAEGKICKETFGDSEALYELRGQHHDHAVCTNCEKITPIACSGSQKVIPGFIADHHHTTVFGICSDCSKI